MRDGGFMDIELREKITENYLSGIANHVSEFELGLARIAFIAGWDLALSNKQEKKDDGTN